MVEAVIHERQAKVSEQSRQNRPACREKQQREDYCISHSDPPIENEQSTQRSGDALATVKPQLHRPDVTSDHRQQRQRRGKVVAAKIPRCPHRQRTLGKISEQRQEEPWCSQNATDVPRPGSPALILSNVPAGTSADEIVTGRETAQ